MPTPSAEAIELLENVKAYFYIGEDEGRGNERRLWVASHDYTIALMLDTALAKARLEGAKAGIEASRIKVMDVLNVGSLNYVVETIAALDPQQVINERKVNV